MSDGVVELASAEDAGLFGGKAANLARAAQGGLPVPEGIAMSTKALASFVAGESQLPAAALALLPGRLAVRSSAIGEDSTKASFAGMLLTRLNVTTADELAMALREVAASANSEAVRTYRAGLGLPEEAAAGAVVQRLIDADVAGVLFTRDPLGGDGMVIEASWGLGEAVVAGLIVPDRVVLRADGSVEKHIVGTKNLRLDPSEAGGVVESELAAAEIERPCLSDDDIARLAAHGRRCEQLYGAPQDLEWAFSDGMLFHLQARRITA